MEFQLKNLKIYSLLFQHLFFFRLDYTIFFLNSLELLNLFHYFSNYKKNNLLPIIINFSIIKTELSREFLILNSFQKH